MPIVPDSFAQHLLDRLQPLGDVRFRPMFGAACLFLDGTAFAILEEGVVFFKIDDVTKPTFTAAGGRAFTYFHKQKNADVEMGYMTIPDDDVDSPALLNWARLAVDASRRKKASPKKAATKKAATKKAATKKAATKKAATKKAATKKAATAKTKKKAARRR